MSKGELYGIRIGSIAGIRIRCYDVIDKCFLHCIMLILLKLVQCLVGNNQIKAWGLVNYLFKRNYTFIYINQRWAHLKKMLNFGRHHCPHYYELLSIQDAQEGEDPQPSLLNVCV